MPRRTHAPLTSALDVAGRGLASSLRTPVERGTPNDVLQLTYDAGSVPAQVGAVLLMAGPTPEPDAARMRSPRESRACPDCGSDCSRCRSVVGVRSGSMT